MACNLSLRTLFVFIWALSAGAMVRPNLVYTLEDLEALYQQKRSTEFIQHAFDLRPSQRNERWRSMLTEMAQTWVKQLVVTGNINKENYLKLKEIVNLPELGPDEFIQRSAANFLMEYLDFCLLLEKNQSSCFTQITQFAPLEALDSATRFKLGTALVKKLPQVFPQSMNTLSPVLTGDFASFYCREEAFQSVLYARLDHQSDLFQKKIRTIKAELLSWMSKDCWQEFLTSTAGKELSSTLTLKLGLALEILSPTNKDVALTTFFLSAPPPSELTNLAWNNLRELKRDYARRAKVLKQLEDKAWLKDDLFGLEDKDTEVKIRHLYESFPEYLHLYSKTCVSYMEGSKQFGRGNPTPHCHNLFELSEGKDWIEAGLMERFKKAKIPTQD